MPSLSFPSGSRTGPDSVSLSKERALYPVFPQEAGVSAFSPLLRFPAGSRGQALAPSLSAGRRALPGKGGERACADPCLPPLSDLFPLIFPSGKWTGLSQ